MSRIGLGALLMLGLVASVSSWACSSDEDSASNATGGQAGAPEQDAQAEAGEAGHSGSAGGKDAGPDGQAGQAGAKDAGPDGPEPGADQALGVKCAQDSDCQEGFHCLKATESEVFGGGPSGGYCSIECTSYIEDMSQPNPCKALAFNSRCVAVSDSPRKAYCMLGCYQGPPHEGGIDYHLDPEKCHGRTDLVCNLDLDDNHAPVGTPYCLPMCQADSDCRSVGRKCDPGHHVCVDTSHTPEGLPFGASCMAWGESAGAQGEACQDTCLGMQKEEIPSTGADPDLSVAFFCTQRCTFNTEMSCGYKERPSKGVCLLANDDTGDGDLAYCIQMCDVDSDCGAYNDGRANVYCATQFAGPPYNWGRGFCFFRYGYHND